MRLMQRARWLFSLAVVTLVLGLLAGCGGGDDVVSTNADPASMADDADISSVSDQGEPVAIDLGALTASTWTLRFGGGPDGEIPIVDGWPITITFEGDTLGGTAACNGYGGTYAIDGSELVLSEISNTDMGCQADVQASEAAYLAALVDVDGINLLGDELALSGMSTELIFFSTDPVPANDLLDQFWLLDSVINEETASTPEGEPATLLIESGGSFIGSTGCRDLSGRYVVSGNNVLFNEMAADGDCPTSLFDQDSLVVSALGDGFVPTIEGDTLIIESAGNQQLRYRAIGEDELSALVGTPAPGDDELLEGIEWVFVGGDSADGLIADPRAIDPTTSITLTFAAGSYSGIVVCNSYGGDAEIGDSLWTFELGVPAAEEEGCGDGLDEITAAYLAALPQMSEGGIEDGGQGLVMNGNDIELLFERAS